ncbi:MAG: acyl-CoA dehydrogenase family protein [Firmicutes bacterium]|nr:acyl-CoA dehydrogenase family protein [Bacillota bacterium]
MNSQGGAPPRLDPHGGGAFLFVPVPAAEVATPEDLSEEALAVGEVPQAFLEREVRPALPALEGHDLGELRRLMARMGELGLLGVEVPRAYGGLELGRTVATLVTERLAPAGGLAVAQGAHAGLATLPLVYFGTEDQKRRYLPRLVTGEWVGAYALTEPGFGSDALHARTRAALRPDGEGYVLTGEKQWITNAGIADLFVVFAQLEGEGFTAFLVERAFPGVDTGGEYEKMGLWSSSTRPLVLNGAVVPTANLLGRPGRGHEVALGILDVSRLNLGAGAVGSAKRLLEVAARYALGRIQFGRPIARFGLVQEKLAEMQVRTWALEAAVYRTAGLIERAGERGIAADEASAAAEYAVECAIAKVLGSEVLGFVADEALQIHGGYGYMREYEVERAYRDARIQRIFEGTNEINRLTIPDTLMRRIRRGRIPFADLARALEGEIAALRRPAFFDAPLAAERWRVDGARRAAAAAAALALERFGADLAEEEEVLGAVADMAIELFAAESALVRAERARGTAREEEYADLAALAVDGAVSRLRAAAVRVLAHSAEGDRRALALATLERLTAFPPLDAISLRRRVASRVLAAYA